MDILDLLAAGVADGCIAITLDGIISPKGTGVLGKAQPCCDIKKVFSFSGSLIVFAADIDGSFHDVTFLCRGTFHPPLG